LVVSTYEVGAFVLRGDEAGLADGVQVEELLEELLQKFRCANEPCRFQILPKKNQNTVYSKLK
jgi:hypothetical protein